MQFAPLDQLLAESDWILPQLPSDTTTRNLIDRPQFARMKQGALVVNVSRADVINRDALIEALTSGRLGGFALDPLYEEPGESTMSCCGSTMSFSCLMSHRSHGSTCSATSRR